MYAVLAIIGTVGELGLNNNTGYVSVAGYSGGCIH